MPAKTRTASDRLASLIRESHDRGQFTDLVLEHDLGNFNVHRVVVCSQFKVLLKACTTGFKEEATGVIGMGHLAYYELQRLVDYFYHADYHDDLGEKAEIQPLQLHVKMFSLGDQYEIPHLSTVAAQKYSAQCTSSWNALEFLTSIADIYETTPSCIRQLRDVACLEIRKHLPGMLNNKTVAEAYEKVLVEVPDFAKDLLKSYVHKPLYGHCIWCASIEPMEALQRRCLTCKKGT